MNTTACTNMRAKLFIDQTFCPVTACNICGHYNIMQLPIVLGKCPMNA